MLLSLRLTYRLERKTFQIDERDPNTFPGTKGSLKASGSLNREMKSQAVEIKSIWIWTLISDFIPLHVVYWFQIMHKNLCLVWERNKEVDFRIVL